MRVSKTPHLTSQSSRRLRCGDTGSDEMNGYRRGAVRAREETDRTLLGRCLDNSSNKRIWDKLGISVFTDLDPLKEDVT